MERRIEIGERGLFGWPVRVTGSDEGASLAIWAISHHGRQRLDGSSIPPSLDRGVPLLFELDEARGGRWVGTTIWKQADESFALRSASQFQPQLAGPVTWEEDEGKQNIVFENWTIGLSGVERGWAVYHVWFYQVPAQPSYDVPPSAHFHLDQMNGVRAPPSTRSIQGAPVGSAAGEADEDSDFWMYAIVEERSRNDQRYWRYMCPSSHLVEESVSTPHRLRRSTLCYDSQLGSMIHATCVP